MELEKQLQLIGLNKSDIKVYLHLLKAGSLSAQNVSRETSITRTNCYHLLGNLVGSGLAVESLVNGKKVFTAKDPSCILKSIDERREKMEKLVPVLKTISGIDGHLVKQHNGLEAVSVILSSALGEDGGVFYGSLHSYSKLFPELFKSAEPAQTKNLGHQSSVAIVLWGSKTAVVDIWDNPFAITISNPEITIFLKALLENVSRETFSSELGETK